MPRKLPRLPRLIPRQFIPVELIQAKAYEIWQARERKGAIGTPEDDYSKAIEFLNQHWWSVTSWKLGKRYQELKISATNSIKEALSFKTLSQAVNASVLIGAITFIAGEQQRRNAQVYQAWQVITAAHAQPGSGGRIQALEFLNSEPRRIPWFWLHYPRESLSGLEAPKAYLIPSGKDLKKKGGIQLSKANLDEANLQGAHLENANLQGAHLENANLQGAHLENASLQRAHLKLVHLQGARLDSAHLQGAYLRNTELQEVTLDNAHLEAADLRNARLEGAHMYNLNLQGAYLENANLQGAYLENAHLQGAHLDNAHLQGAYLRSTELQGVPLDNAHLEAADLSNARLEGAHLENALYTDNSTIRETCELFAKHCPCPTTFPKDFDPKARGMELVK
ncbi:MAG: pentapeptide repeat-containing protein [Stigonema ocellatum SAG 48.90 = DSM 106950]|nr:pentapeptide repeat-containing protein [Stigonema ocellatum SAG 48.90 = DSM 106950]